MCICTFLCIAFPRGQALDAFSYQTKEPLFHYEHFSIKHKTKFNSIIQDMADHPWPFTQKRYLRCGIYIISNNTIIYDYPKIIECTLCEHSIVMYSSSGLLLYLYFAITTRYPLSHSFTAIYRSDHTVYPTVVLFRVYRSNDFSSNTAGQQLAEQAKELVLRSCHTIGLHFFSAIFAMYAPITSGFAPFCSSFSI